MKTSDFDYALPPDRIAQHPANPRDHSRLLVLDRKTGQTEHRHFFEIGDYLKPGDLLVVNESKVFKARLKTDDGVEIFLLRPDGTQWLALAKPGRKIRPGSIVSFADGTMCDVIDKKIDGTVVLDFKKSADEIFAWVDRVGEVPTPPYVKMKQTTDGRRQTTASYQTVYAKQVGSVAAPTAGFHFTPELIDKLKALGIRFATVTLHVGLGTFRPMKTETVEEHIMHEEWIDVPDATRFAIDDTRQQGGLVIAVGTTTVRALESTVHHGFTNIFITPGYRFKYIDGLITNFHLPKSTLLVLVSAFAGRDNVLNAYQQAIARDYRFYSFGDAMLIV